MRTAQTLFLLFALAGAAHTQSATLVRDGGVLGATCDFTLGGDPFEKFVLIPSISAGPTPLSILNPADTRALSVGLESVDVWAAGILSAAGSASVSYPLPGDAAIQGLAVWAQWVSFPGSPFLVDDISNGVSLVLALPETSTYAVGDLGVALTGHTSTRLADGTVLLAGGVESGGVTGALRAFDPQTQTITTLGATLATPRTAHSATLLSDGRLLFLGGANALGTILASGEIYDPAAGTVGPIAPMSVARTQHTATLVGDGRVFVAGGTSSFDFSDPLGALASLHASTALYTPSSGTWSNGPAMPKPRAGHAASLTGNGQVLITGGIEVTFIFGIPFGSVSSDCRRFNPSTNTLLTAPSLSGPRFFHGQATLSNGDALVAGGVDGDLITLVFTPLSSARLYDTSTNTWSSVASLATARANPNLVEVPGGVLAIGGLSTIDVAAGTGTPVTAIERTDLAGSAWSAAGSLLLPRALALATSIENGLRVLVSGAGDNGSGGTIPDETVELYVP